MVDLASILDVAGYDITTRYLLDITLIMIIGGVCAVWFSRLRMPVVIGYLVAGLLVGPKFPLQLVQDVDLINFMADLGIILLMFTIGLEFNLKKLKSMGLAIVLAGTIEVIIMVVFGYVLGTALGWSSVESLFLGAVLSGSSTAVIVKVLTETGRIKKEYALPLIGLLIIEDFASVFIMALTSPIITGTALSFSSVMVTIVTIGAFVAISLILGAAIIPKAMDMISKKYSSEVLLLVALGLCFSLAFISQLLGFSVAIGAFIMGIIVSQAPPIHQIVSSIKPIEEMFMAVFFVSIGMLIDPVVIVNNIGIVLLIAAVFTIGKVIAVTVGGFTANIEGKTAMTIGMSMVVMGEFAYVIAKMGSEAGVVSSSFYSTIIGASLVTMLAMPVLSKRTDQTIWWVARHIPVHLKNDIKHLEDIRGAVREKLALSSERQSLIRKEAVWIMVDVSFMFILLFSASMLHDFVLALNPLGHTNLEIISYIFFIQIIVALLLPALFNINKRVHRIAEIMASSIMEPTGQMTGVARLIYRTIMALVGVVVFIIMLSFLDPLFDILTGVPIGLLAIFALVGVVLIYLLWNLLKSFHDRVFEGLSKGIVHDDQPSVKGPPEKGTF
jgi:CPA2 family monovalent cation:H+ antiporter-2